PCATAVVPSACIRTKTAWWSCAGGWRRKRARCCCKRWPLPSRVYQQQRQTFVDDVSAETPPLEQQPPAFEQQQADALTLLAESALHHGIDPGAPGERYQVVVHVDAPVLADPEAPGQSVLEDGVRVSAETSQRLACDASRVVMQHGRDGCVVEV